MYRVSIHSALLVPVPQLMAAGATGSVLSVLLLVPYLAVYNIDFSLRPRDSNYLVVGGSTEMASTSTEPNSATARHNSADEQQGSGGKNISVTANLDSAFNELSLIDNKNPAQKATTTPSDESISSTTPRTADIDRPTSATDGRSLSSPRNKNPVNKAAHQQEEVRAEAPQEETLAGGKADSPTRVSDPINEKKVDEETKLPCLQNEDAKSSSFCTFSRIKNNGARARPRAPARRGRRRPRPLRGVVSRRRALSKGGAEGAD